MICIFCNIETDSDEKICEVCEHEIKEFSKEQRENSLNLLEEEL